MFDLKKMLDNTIGSLFGKKASPAQTLSTTNSVSPARTVTISQPRSQNLSLASPSQVSLQAPRVSLPSLQSASPISNTNNSVLTMKPPTPQPTVSIARPQTPQVTLAKPSFQPLSMPKLQPVKMPSLQMGSASQPSLTLKPNQPYIKPAEDFNLGKWANDNIVKPVVSTAMLVPDMGASAALGVFGNKSQQQAAHDQFQQDYNGSFIGMPANQIGNTGANIYKASAADTYNKTNTAVLNNLNANSKQAISDANAGKISWDEAKQRIAGFNQAYNQSGIGKMANQATSDFSAIDPVKAAGDAAGSFLTIATLGNGKTKLDALGNPVTQSLPKRVIQNTVSGAALGSGFNTVGTASQLGKDATAQDYLNSAGAGAAMGGGLGLLGTVAKPTVEAATPYVKKGVQAVSDAIPTIEKKTLAHPEWQAIVAQHGQYVIQKQALLDRGASVNSAPVKQIDNAMRNLGQEANVTYKRIYDGYKQQSQAGFATFPFLEKGEKAIPQHVQEHAQSFNTPDQLVKQSTDSAYRMSKQNKGGALIDTNSPSDPYSSSASKTRISENDPFYRQYFKENGKAPTKAAYAAEIQRQYEQGGGSLVDPQEATAYGLVKQRAADNNALVQSAPSAPQVGKTPTQFEKDLQKAKLGASTTPTGQGVTRTNSDVPLNTASFASAKSGISVNTQRVSPQIEQPGKPLGQQNSISSPFSNDTPTKIKVAQRGGDKAVPVMDQHRSGDVITATNVNPNIKANEKRYSVGDDGKLLEDKKGATSLFTNGDGKVTGFRVGKEYFSEKQIGDLTDVNSYGSSLVDQRRNVERSFGKDTADKVNTFLVDHQQAQATQMIDRKVQLKTELESLQKDLGINFTVGRHNAKKVSAAIQDFGEGKRNMQSLVDEFGQEKAAKIVKADKWFRNKYDSLLNEMNGTLTQYGYDPVPKHKDYYTHFQDTSVWKRFGLKMHEIGDALSPTMQDSAPDAARGTISNGLVGQSAFTKPNKMFNKFALRRRGETPYVHDAFGAFEAYLNPTLNNIYMTPSIARARVISRAIAQDADMMGKDATGIINQTTEWANSLAGKSNALGDRWMSDHAGGRLVLKGMQWVQRKAGANSILGNLNTAVMQPIVLAQTTGKFGYKNTLAGMMQNLTTSADSLMAQSPFMRRRYADTGSTTGGKLAATKNIANKPLEFVEKQAVKITWLAAHNDALSQGMKGKAAIHYADVQTQATVSGRSIGDKPELFRSKSAGIFTMYQLEVSNFWQQFGKEMSVGNGASGKIAAAKTVVTLFAINSALQALTGNQVGFNPIQAAIDSYDESQKPEKSAKDKAIAIGQRLAGEVVDNVPLVNQAANFTVGDTKLKKMLGMTSDVGRFGVNSPLSSIASTTDVKIGNNTYTVPQNLIMPFGGSQTKKTYEGVSAVASGKVTDSQGKTLVDVPQTPANIIRGTLFGKNAIPEVNQYYQNVGKDKVDQKPVANQKESVAGSQGLNGLTLDQQKVVSGLNPNTANAYKLQYNEKNALDRQKAAATPTTTATSIASITAEKDKQKLEFQKAFSPNDYALLNLSKTDRKTAMNSGLADQAKFDGLDAYANGVKDKLGMKTSTSTPLPSNMNSTASKLLTDYEAMDTTAKKAWSSKPSSDTSVKSTLQSWVGDRAKLPDTISNTVAKQWANYEKGVADGSINKLQQDDAKKSIIKSAYDDQLSDTQKSITSLSKDEINYYIKNQSISNQDVDKALAVEKQLYDAGVISKETLARKLGASARGYKTSGGSSGSSKKGKFDYKLNGFSTASNSGTSAKAFYDLLKKAKLA